MTSTVSALEDITRDEWCAYNCVIFGSWDTKCNMHELSPSDTRGCRKNRGRGTQAYHSLAKGSLEPDEGSHSAR